MSPTTLCVVLSLAALVACLPVSVDDDTVKEGDCDPLSPLYCMLPFPNNIWLKEDASTPSGFRLNLSKNTLPISRLGVKIDPSKGGWNDLDGFSVFPAIVSVWPGVDLNASRAAGHDNMGDSLAPDHPTILMDASTGELLPHWVEVDEAANNEGDDNEDADPNTAFIMWPIARLKPGNTYIAAIRGLVDSEGTLFTPSPAFAALRDGTPSPEKSVEDRRIKFEAIFDQLTAAGVSRDSLQLAWDFSTGSDESITKRMVFMRDDALARVANGVEYKITKVTDDYNDNIYRKIEGTFTVPVYSTRNGLPGGHMVIGKDGLPVYQGTAQAKFTVLIPHSVANNKTSGRILQYGHGLLGDQSEVGAGYLGEEANRYGYVLGAVNEWGLCEFDVPSIILMMADVTKFGIIPDRLQQGILNELIFMRLMMTTLATAPEVTFDGVSALDTNRRSYYGNSQGGIMGAMYMALSTDVERGTLGVGGAPYGLLLPRSHDFDKFMTLIRARFKSALSRYMLIQTFQLLWDRGEPIGYCHEVESGKLANGFKHRVLAQYGLGDQQVSWLGTYNMMRTMGTKMFEQHVVEGKEVVYGIELVSNQGQYNSTSIGVGWDFGVPIAPEADIPPHEGQDTHEKPRREPAAQEQMYKFFEEGSIVDTCDGPCIHIL